MEFSEPEGLNPKAPIENNQMNWDISFSDGSSEIRYAVQPLGKLIERYKEFEKNKKEGNAMIHPNKIHFSALQATVLSIAGGRLPELDEFDSEAVKSEFNADWGATTLVAPSGRFAQEYRLCMVIALHKDDCANAYIFYMANSQNDLQKLMAKSFHQLIYQE